ncbi:hypothetical protein SUNI508_00013 [Seiridium unicorne]|uniref:Uncharacterized protein n=1 Tax=Seiridium unicorne TaxID=138068 RepID=A0ABR2VI79_9PEZI
MPTKKPTFKAGFGSKPIALSKEKAKSSRVQRQHKTEIEQFRPRPFIISSFRAQTKPVDDGK